MSIHYYDILMLENEGVALGGPKGDGVVTVTSTRGNAFFLSWEVPMKPSDIVSKSSPMQLFEEYTFLHEEDWRKAITDRCIACRAIPMISYHAEHGWLFHSLSIDDRIYRKGCSLFFEKPKTVAMTEHDFEVEISEFLTQHGIPNKRQVHCETGIVDIATENAVIEVKLRPHQDGWLKAIGQAVSYRSAIGVRYAVIMSVSLVPNWVAKSCRSVGIECFNRSALNKLASHITEEISNG